MKKKALLILTLFSVATIFGQLKQSTIKYVPIKNIYGWETKKNAVYFNPELCEQSYFSINLTAFDISVKNEKRLWAKYSPFLYVKIEVGDKEYINIVKTANISKHKWNENSIARSINNLPVIGPFPYLGENVTVTVNLYAYKTKDNLETAINSISNFTSLFPNQLNTFIEVSKKVKQSLDFITPKCRSLVSYSATWKPKQAGSLDRPNLFKEGFYIIHPINQALDENKVHVNDLSQIKHKQNSTQETFLFEKHVDYIVMEFEHFVSRKDFQTFPFYKKYKSAQLNALRNEAEDMEKSFKNAMTILHANDNFTYHDKKVLHNMLYKELLVQITNHRKNYNASITPVADCNPLNNINFQVTSNVVREKLIEEGLIQPGEQIKTSYRSYYDRLSPLSKQFIETKLVANYKIEKRDVNDVIIKLDNPSENFKQKNNNLLEELEDINKDLELKIPKSKLIELTKDIKKRNIQPLINNRIKIEDQ